MVKISNFVTCMLLDLLKKCYRMKVKGFFKKIYFYPLHQLGRDSEWERNKLALHAGGEDVGFLPLMLPDVK